MLGNKTAGSLRTKSEIKKVRMSQELKNTTN